MFAFGDVEWGLHGAKGGVAIVAGHSVGEWTVYTVTISFS